jgi:hypothetical protein
MALSPSDEIFRMAMSDTPQQQTAYSPNDADSIFRMAMGEDQAESPGEVRPEGFWDKASGLAGLAQQGMSRGLAETQRGVGDFIKTAAEPVAASMERAGLKRSNIGAMAYDLGESMSSDAQYQIDEADKATRLMRNPDAGFARRAAETVAEGTGGLIGALPAFVGGGAVTAPLKAVPAVGGFAASAGQFGLAEGLMAPEGERQQAFIEGAPVGAVFHGANMIPNVGANQVLKRIPRMAATAGVTGGGAALSGADPAEVVGQTFLGAGMGVGGGERAVPGIRERFAAIREARKAQAQQALIEPALVVPPEGEGIATEPMRLANENPLFVEPNPQHVEAPPVELNPAIEPMRVKKETPAFVEPADEMSPRVKFAEIRKAKKGRLAKQELVELPNTWPDGVSPEPMRLENDGKGFVAPNPKQSMTFASTEPMPVRMKYPKFIEPTVSDPFFETPPPAGSDVAPEPLRLRNEKTMFVEPTAPLPPDYKQIQPIQNAAVIVKAEMKSESPAPVAPAYDAFYGDDPLFPVQTKADPRPFFSTEPMDFPAEVPTAAHTEAKVIPVEPPPAEMPLSETTPSQQAMGIVYPLGFQRVASLARKLFTPRGDLPQPVFDAKIRRDGWMSRNEVETKYVMRDYEKAAKDTYGGLERMSDADTQAISAVLNGKADVKTLPAAMQGPVQNMRAHVDALSRRLVDSGAVEGNLAAVVENNMGAYLNRSYRVFDDPQWAQQVPMDVRNKAKALIRSEFPNLSDAEVEGQIESLLFKRNDGPIAALREAKLGSKDLSILKRREDIPEEIRALWGEYKDPRVNYAKSVSKMGHLVANHQFLEQVKTDGLGQFLFENPIVKDGKTYQAPIAAEGSRTMAPLNGLYTTPEVKAAFEKMGETIDSSNFTRIYMAVNTATKVGKTVGSVKTHVRNFLANPMIAMANGHWRVGKISDSMKAIGADIGLSNNANWRKFYSDLTQLGVVGESARGNELRAMLKDSFGSDIDTYTGSRIGRLARKAASLPAEMYRAEDDFWKVYGFANEVARYQKAMPNRPIEEIKRIAAENIRNTYPTYSMVGQGIKNLRRFPVVGTFPSFAAEIWRTSYNNVRLAAKELKDPQLKSIGVERAAGILAAMTLPAAAATASRFLSGVTKSEEDDMRRFLPPWQQNANLMQIGKSGEGQYKYIDVSYLDPYEYIKKPVMGMLRGENWEEGFSDAMKEALSPFMSEEILFKAVREVMSNKAETGREIYNEQETDAEKVGRSIKHIGKAIEPGTISDAKRIYKGATGEVEPWGRKYDPSTEALAMVSGQRIQDIDVRQAISFKARKGADAIRQSERIFSEAAQRKGTVSDVELAQSRQRSETARMKLFGELREDALSAIRLGVSTGEVRRALREGGVNTQNMIFIMTGNYRSYVPSVETQKNIPIERRRHMSPIVRTKLGEQNSQISSAH